MILTSRQATIDAGEAAIKQYARAAAQHVTAMLDSEIDSNTSRVRGLCIKRLDRAILQEIIEANRLPFDGWPLAADNPAPRLMEYPNE